MSVFISLVKIVSEDKDRKNLCDSIAGINNFTAGSDYRNRMRSSALFPTAITKVGRNSRAAHLNFKGIF